MTPRGTDWGLAALVAALFATGMVSLFAAAPGHAWVFALHDVLAFALAALVVVKLRRVWHRLARPSEWDRGVKAGVLVVVFVSLALLSGWLWSGVGEIFLFGYSLMAWHLVLGGALFAAVAVHMWLRAQRIRRRDVANRRQFLVATGVAAGAVALWQLQRPATALVGLRSAKRRFTGSYEAGSFTGNEFPSTSWVADDPREIDAAAFRLAVAGKVAQPVELTYDELAGASDALTATLDCTGGFYSTQHWRGLSLASVLDRVAPASEARYVRVISVTGYRWSFDLRTARKLLLATHVGDEPLSHGHGAPVRLVAPDRRGFEWVKWVTRIELHEDDDLGAPASTVWSSLTAKGRGAA